MKHELKTFVDYDRDIVWCGECDLGARRENVFRAHGFRLVVPCACGAKVATGLRREDLPRFEIDFDAVDEMGPLARAVIARTKAMPGRWIYKYPGIEIDSDTPVWALDYPVNPRSVAYGKAA